MEVAPSCSKSTCTPKTLDEACQARSARASSPYHDKLFNPKVTVQDRAHSLLCKSNSNDKTLSAPNYANRFRFLLPRSPFVIGQTGGPASAQATSPVQSEHRVSSHSNQVSGRNLLSRRCLAYQPTVVLAVKAPCTSPFWCDTSKCL